MASPRRRSFLWSMRAYFRQVNGLLVIGSIAGVLMNVAIVLPPVLLGNAINVVLAYKDGTATAAAVGWAAVLFVLGTAATEVPRVGKRWWLGVARTRLQANVRSDAFRGVLAWPMARFSTMSVGGVMARVVGDVEVLGIGVGEVIVETWDTLLFSVSLVVAMFLYDPGLAALALAPVPIALWVAKVSGRRVAARTVNARQSDADLTSLLHEQLSGHLVLRLAGRREAAAARVGSSADRQARSELSAIRLGAGLLSAYTTMLSLGVVAVIWLGGNQVANGSLSVGGLVAFLALFTRFIGRAPRIPQMANRVQASAAAYGRLEDLLAPPVSLAGEPRWSSFRATRVAGMDRAPDASRERTAGPARLTFEEVSFSYPGAEGPALRDLDLEVPAGSLVAVTGPVGSGKSALAKLAVGVLTPEEGRVAVDGVAIGDLGDLERARVVGYVPQDPSLFSGSILDNVTLRSTDEDANAATRVRRAMAISAIDDDVRRMPDGLRTEIGELGVRVSGGQRQRIALARAIVANGLPRLLVLDDPFSAVDVHTEAAIVEAFRSTLQRAERPSERSTILLCSHRLAAFPVADTVVVLESGRIEEQGTHAELLAAGGLYARIYRAQARLASAVTHGAGSGR